MVNSLNIADVILILVILLAVYNGWHKGFLDSLTELAIWLGSFLMAFFGSGQVIRLLLLFGLNENWVRPVLFVVLLVAFSRLIINLFDRLSSKIPEEVHVHWSNKVAGVIPGLISGVIYASLISFFLLSYPLGNLSQRTKDSKLAGLLNKPEEWPGKLVDGLAADLGHIAARDFTVHTNGSEIISLPFKTDSYQRRPDLEIRMLQLINLERKKSKLEPMAPDPKLAVVATAHSAEMLRLGYFSHYSLNGKSPFDRMRTAGVRFKIAGENLALAQTLQSAHEGLMESPVHKANILSSSFGRVGISILDTGIHGIIVTQNFRN